MRNTRTLVIIGVIGILFLVGKSLIPEGPDTVLKRLNEEEIFLKSIKIPYQDSLFMHLMVYENQGAPTLILIHGSPGDWSAWKNIITNDSVRNYYNIILVDRPGFGKTSIGPMASLELQAGAIWSSIKHLNLINPVLVGHSYGGAVVEQLLVDYPGIFKMAILVAATLSPELMQPRWYNTIASWNGFSKLLPEDLLASNIEMTGLPESLQKIERKINQITTPIIFIQGEADVLVPYETVNYFKAHKPNGVDYILIEDLNHFIPWTDPHLINDVLLNKSKY